MMLTCHISHEKKISTALYVPGRSGVKMSTILCSILCLMCSILCLVFYVYSVLCLVFYVYSILRSSILMSSILCLVFYVYSILCLVFYMSIVF